MFPLIHLKFPCPSSWLWEMRCAISPLPTTQRLHLNLLKSCDSTVTFTCTASAPHFVWGEVTKGSSTLEFLMASVTFSFLGKNIKSVLLHLGEWLIWYLMSSIKIFSCSISNNIVVSSEPTPLINILAVRVKQPPLCWWSWTTWTQQWLRWASNTA